jgi:O-antigen/teichoic acid export membrane protein
MLILAIAYALIIVVGLGLDLTLVKFISAETNHNKRAEEFSTILLLRVTLSLLVGILVYWFGHLVLPLLNDNLHNYIAYLAVLCILSSLKELFFRLFQGLYLFTQYGVVSVVSACIKFSLILGVSIVSTLGLDQLLFLEIAALFACLALQCFVLPFETLKPFRMSISTFRRVVRFGFPLYLNNIVRVVQSKGNIFIMAALLDPGSIGLFEVARKIPEGFQRFYGSFTAVYFPSISRMFSEKRVNEAQRLMNSCLTVLSMGSIFLALVSLVFGERIMGMVFSDAYIGAAMAFVLLMLDLQLKVISYTMGYSLVSAGYSSVPLKVDSIAGMIGVGSSVLLIPVYGFLGAVYSCLIVSIVGNCGNYYYLRKAGIIADVQSYLSPVIVFLVIGGFWELFDIKSVYLGMVVVAMYGLSCLMLHRESRSVVRFGSQYMHVKWRSIYR